MESQGEWLEAWHRDGSLYYVHRTTGKTSMTRPDAVNADAQAAQSSWDAQAGDGGGGGGGGGG
eukprot:CAMPEP_0182579368 /NCGR_PEP_ID=MMETSP1324-20130603/43993_1 /TAXON_ID=236786 /ORGANISM="Florenciella sp., Strain RCC1587" /LENGTH=62 /DNA_ID=CAMNT_0024795457 /DNA_START=138 /DNA_END=322 /DNA_ORIENTATION=-